MGEKNLTCWPTQHKVQVQQRGEGSDTGVLIRDVFTKVTNDLNF